MATSPRQEVAVERRILSTEHREIEHVLGGVQTTAEMAGNLASGDLASALRSLLDSVERTLLPQLDWADTLGFPEMDRLTATPWATRLLRLQHQQIRQSVEYLEAHWLALRREPSHRQLVDLRARLYELHALLGSHLEQEEAVVLQLLHGRASRLPPADAS